MKPDAKLQRIFVEGPSDAAVVNKLVLSRLQLDLSLPAQRIMDASVDEGGFDAALERFRSALAARRPARLGLIVDRDGLEGKPDRWHAVARVLADLGLTAPAWPEKTGTRSMVSWGRVGVWFMPDNISPGDLETFLEGLVPPPTALWAHAEKATQLAKDNGAPYRDGHRSKARFHAWLAWQDPPGQPYGLAIQSGALITQSPAVDAFLDWFRWLCLEED